jgi:hypothetical protein
MIIRGDVVAHTMIFFIKSTDNIKNDMGRYESAITLQLAKAATTGEEERI